MRVKNTAAIVAWIRELYFSLSGTRCLCHIVFLHKANVSPHIPEAGAVRARKGNSFGIRYGSSGTRSYRGVAIFLVKGHHGYTGYGEFGHK